MSLPPGVTPADIEGGRCPSRHAREVYICEKCGELCDLEKASEDAYTLEVCETCLPVARTAALQELIELRRKLDRLKRGIEEQLEKAA
jgi:hypothetical protein